MEVGKLLIYDDNMIKLLKKRFWNISYNSQKWIVEEKLLMILSESINDVLIKYNI